MFSTKTAEETEKLAEMLIKKILKKKVLLLSGELGSGKTTFVKGLAKALGVTQLIKSPTFVYVNRYPLLTTHYKLQTLFHFDLYRLPENSSSFPELEEALLDKRNIIAVEWPEKLSTIKTTPCLSLHFEKKEMEHFIKILHS